MLPDSPSVPGATSARRRILRMPRRRPVNRVGVLTVCLWLTVGSLPGARAASKALAPVPSVLLEDLTWPELRDAVLHGKTVAIIPIGGTEQSGPELALGKQNARVQVPTEGV